MRLAPYAASDASSRGRVYDEPGPAHRTEFQRDRDRIIHSTAFRRLEYKTQVFVNHEGDHYRTRLTHSIEVAQIARTVARALSLNEDLTEAIALAHDLGHTPFGHAGQDALNACLADYGGFEHNLHSIRIVEVLERRYAAFPGLNLSFETREGMLKHCPGSAASELGPLGERFLLGRQPSLEAQVANLADEIAYNNHDIDDGVRSGLLDFDAVLSLSPLQGFAREVGALGTDLPERVRVNEFIRRLISAQVGDLIDTSESTISDADPRDVDDVRRQPGPLIRFSASMQELNQVLKAYLHENLYRHAKVKTVADQSAETLGRLFARFYAQPDLLPARHRPQADDAMSCAHSIRDYIAGMTDRFALKQAEQLGIKVSP